jgi:hypothetical protein
MKKEKKESGTSLYIYRFFFFFSLFYLGANLKQWGKGELEKLMRKKIHRT